MQYPTLAMAAYAFLDPWRPREIPWRLRETTEDQQRPLQTETSLKTKQETKQRPMETKEDHQTPLETKRDLQRDHQRDPWRPGETT